VIVVASSGSGGEVARFLGVSDGYLRQMSLDGVQRRPSAGGRCRSPWWRGTTALTRLALFVAPWLSSPIASELASTLAIGEASSDLSFDDLQNAGTAELHFRILRT
jgi:hypothetical protein